MTKNKEGGGFAWFVLAGLAVPLLWGLIFVVDSIVLFRNLESLWYRLLYMLVAFCLFVFFILSMGNRIFPLGERSPKLLAGLRALFSVLFTIGVAFYIIYGANYISWLALVQLGLAYVWILMPYFVLKGNEKALRVLNVAMIIGIIYWILMFLIMAATEGTGTMLYGILSFKALIFLALTFFWYLLFAYGKGKDGGPFYVSITGAATGNGWQNYFFLCLATSLSLVCIWVLTGFTNNGAGQYGDIFYMSSFPFYDVAAYLQPFSFSNGPFLLLHAIPISAFVVPDAVAGYSRVMAAMTPVLWLGLVCLAIAVYGIFCSVLASRHVWPMRIFSIITVIASALSFWQIMRIRNEFVARTYDCRQMGDALPMAECRNVIAGADSFMLAGQYIPALVFCVLALVLAAVLLVMWNRKGRPADDANVAG